MRNTGFFYDERCFWHTGGNYADMLPVGGLVQPMEGGLPESPESKRRLKNLIEVTGLAKDLQLSGADPATSEDLHRVHTKQYLSDFQRLSDADGGELGRRTPFAKGGFDIAALSAGLAKTALSEVLSGHMDRAYALSRPPGHHCLPGFPNGFCLLANIAIAIEAARAKTPDLRIAVLDWDVHHGNGTEAIFYEDPLVLTVSIHQERNYPMDSGDFTDRGRGPGEGANLNIPLPAGVGHNGYLAAMERVALPAIQRFAPDVIIIACGYDAAGNDPLGRMLASQATFAAMTDQVSALADDICGGKLVMVHEGGYSQTYVPFCAHAVLERLSGSDIHAPDPYGETWANRQPNRKFDTFVETILDDMAKSLR